MANMHNIEEFNTSMFNCGLSALEFEGQPSTLTNGTMWQRLDHALVNACWMDCYPATKVLHLPRGRSDDSPLLINYGDGRSNRSSFRFLNVWSNHTQFLEVVSKKWKKSISGVGMSGFSQS